MPSTSPSQKRLMAAVAHGWHKPGGGGPPVSVAKEFNKADQSQRGSAVNKNYESKTQSFAQGGAVLGRSTNFMKTPDQFRTDKSNATDETFGKGMKGGGDGGPAAPPAKGKSLPAVMPKS